MFWLVGLSMQLATSQRSFGISICVQGPALHRMQGGYRERAVQIEQNLQVCGHTNWGASLSPLAATGVQD